MGAVCGADVAVLVDGPPLLKLAAEAAVGAEEVFKVFVVLSVRHLYFIRANVVAAPVGHSVVVFAG